MWIIVGIFIITAAALVALVLKISSQVNSRLAEMNRSLQDAQRSISSNLGSAANMIGTVSQTIGRLEQSNLQIIDISKDISSLQDLLRSPKFRGQFGETLLENLLSQVLPKDYYQMQYRFKSAEAVDAVVKLGGKLVPVDAKFSLENFQKMAEASAEQEKNALRRKFSQDIKNRIDEISAKYILPAENTYDFALMYIPAENVYYEVIIKEELFSYSISRHVIPVSPNTLYAYLQVICLGLKGLKIEENAVEILKHLSMLTTEISRVRDDFASLGTHLKNAAAKFEDSQKRLERFSDKLQNIQDSKQAAPLSRE